MTTKPSEPNLLELQKQARENSKEIRRLATEALTLPEGDPKRAANEKAIIELRKKNFLLSQARDNKRVDQAKQRAESVIAERKELKIDELQKKFEALVEDMRALALDTDTVRRKISTSDKEENAVDMRNYLVSIHRVLLTSYEVLSRTVKKGKHE
jgi:tryptophanyl-tRNA synthetase